MQLSEQQAKDLDDAAADAWNQTSGVFRCAKAREIFRRDSRVTGFDAATIILLVRVAWEIWKWWKVNNYSNTSEVPRDLMTEVFEPSFKGAK
jgi:hypothetical protein